MKLREDIVLIAAVVCSCLAVVLCIVAGARSLVASKVSPARGSQHLGVASDGVSDADRAHVAEDRQHVAIGGSVHLRGADTLQSCDALARVEPGNRVVFHEHEQHPCRIRTLPTVEPAKAEPVRCAPCRTRAADRNLDLVRSPDGCTGPCVYGHAKAGCIDCGKPVR